MSSSPRNAASAAGLAERSTLGHRPGFDGALASARIAPTQQVGSPAQGIGIIERTLIAYARGPEHPAKIRILHWLMRRLTGGRLRVHYAGRACVTIDPADYIGWSILRTGSYEPTSLALALELLTASPGLFVDVGANFGWYACAVAALPGARVLAIEADSINCAALRTNLAAFPNVAIVGAAAGADFDIAAIAPRSAGNSGSVTILPRAPESGAPHEWTSTVALDALLGRIVAPPSRPALIKIDVEGSELDVLRGLDFDGPFRPRNVIMEYTIHSEQAWGGLAGVEAYFAARGYEVSDVFGRPLDHSSELPESNIWARDR